MQKELQLALLVIGGLFIVGILVHGFWVTRKQRNRDSHFRFESRRDAEPRFNSSVNREEYGEGSIKPTHSFSETEQNNNYSFEETHNKEVAPPQDDAEFRDSGSGSGADLNIEAPFESKEQLHSQDDNIPNAPSTEPQITQQKPTEQASQVKPPETHTEESAPLYADVVTQPKPEFVKEKVSEPIIPDEPPAFLLKQNGQKDTSDSTAKKESPQENHVTSDKRKDPDTETDIPRTPAEELVLEPVESEKSQSLASQAKKIVRKKSKSLADKLRREPSIGQSSGADDEQMRIDFGESRKADSAQASRGKTTRGDNHNSKDNHQENVKNDKAAPEQEVIVLNVQTTKDNPIEGATLLQMLLTLGFKFGDHDIFHRHVNTNGKGPVLFSLANLFKPGVFDIDNIEKFTTQGLSLFMMLPIEGEAQQVFNMMHNAARKIAEEFNGKVLDANKVPISKQSLQQYAERIRDFERRQHKK